MKRKYAETIVETEPEEKGNDDDSKQHPASFQRTLDHKQLLDLFRELTPLISPLLSIVYSYYIPRIHIVSSVYGNLALVDGTMFAWGSNDRGQLWWNDRTHRLSPTTIAFPEMRRVKQIAANHYHSLVLTEDETLFGWGRNHYGQLGTGDTIERLIPTPVFLSKEHKGKRIAMGYDFNLLLIENGMLFTWGNNDAGQLGTGDTVGHWTPTPVALPNGQKAKRVAAGLYHSLVVTENGTLFAWGNNAHGQLGTGNYNNCLTPMLVALPDGQKAKQIAAGDIHSLVVTENGSLFVWGDNQRGQLGTGDTIERLIPTLVALPDGQKAKRIVGGDHHSLVATENGTLFAWGGNDGEQLGTGDYIDHLTPTRVVMANGQKVKRVSTGHHHSLISTEDGMLLAWGSNEYGQLGTDDEMDQQSTILFGPLNSTCSYSMPV